MQLSEISADPAPVSASEGLSDTVVNVVMPRLGSDISYPSHISSDASTSQGPLPASSPPGAHIPLPILDVRATDEMSAFDLELPPEIATADISIAPNGSFVETSSGAAAIELKRLYDQFIGVGRDVRSPYAITAFINQHGKQMYRVGLRELSAPAASGEDAEHRSTHQYRSAHGLQQFHPEPPHTKRRSRMSVHSILPSSVFKNGVTSTSGIDSSRSPPVRKLRKTRSIPNIHSVGSHPSANHIPHRTSTGRPHAHSVSSADTFSIPVSVAEATVSGSRRDIFADVMLWPDAPVLPSASSSVSSCIRGHHLRRGSSSDSPVRASDPSVHPFGPGVSFDSPSWRSEPHPLSRPILREMQSFESGLTARADSHAKLSTVDNSRVHSPIHGEALTEVTTSRFAASSDGLQSNSASLADTIMYSRYSTEVFDVLQISRGLPALDRLSSTSQETTIRLSLRADDSAAPRDDPRFVVWGQVQPDEPEEMSLSSMTDHSAGISGASPSRRVKGVSPGSSDSVSVPVSPGEGPMKMLVAATIERWIAQLTSELNYDELLAFFLTYRTYVSSLDLGHLLICRFHWALGEPKSSRDEMVRRIVRVRTFTAMRYWVVTFFDADFVPNRELRLLYANWLNALGRDPVLQRHKDALKIVRQLRKVFLERKDAHIRRGMKQGGRQTPARPSGKNPVLETLPNSQTTDLTGRSMGSDTEDLDLDLGFDNDVAPPEQGLGINTPSIGQAASGPLDLAMLRQPLHLAFLQYGKKSPASMQLSHIPHPILLPVHHNALSRVLVNTIGRLGRWKRVLNARGPGRTPLNSCLDVSAFDVEANETGDLLLVRGGVEQYLKMVNQMSQTTLVDGRYSSELSPTIAPPSGPPLNALREHFHSKPSSPPANLHDLEAESRYVPAATSPSTRLASRHISISTAYPSSLDAPTFVSPESSPSLSDRQLQLEVVSVDDMDLSDVSSEEKHDLASPHGLKKPPRRLPTRRDFEFVRQPTDSVSSMGIRTRESLRSGTSSSSAGQDLGGTIQQWQVNALVNSLSDEEEAGDVEAALRRLEGQINEEKQRAKQWKVDQWVQSIQERQATHCSSSSHIDSSDEDYGEVEYVSRHETVDELGDCDCLPRASALRSSAGSPIPTTSCDSTGEDATGQSTEQIVVSSASEVEFTVVPMVEAKPVVEDAVPIEILQSRVDSGPLATAPSPNLIMGSMANASAAGSVVHPENMKRHHSFVLGCRTEILMHHFSMIDRELFLNIRFEELVSPHLTGPEQDTDILDWARFLRERARLKAEGRVGHQTASLTVVRGRFNLIANFVISEIVLTHPTERMHVITKFIRLAWKAYELKNFNTLVAVVAGLRSHWVTRAVLQCPDRLRLHDKRILDDLASWTSKKGHFMYVRQTVEALTEAKPIEVRSQDASVVSADGQSTRSRAVSESKPHSAPACVPFFGIYLSQLQQYVDLPDLIDPTAPHEPVGIDPLTNTFEAPAHPEVFSTLAPLPPSMQLEPLINVHKQRLIACVVKSFVAAQHLASRVQFPLDKKLYQKCLKLRGLDTDTLERALALYSDIK